MARGWLFKILHLWLFFSTSIADDNTEENILEKIDHAQSFLESFLAGTADHMFSDGNLFLHSAKGDESEEIIHDKATSPDAIKIDFSDEESDNQDTSQLIINDGTYDNSDSGFDYFKVLKENFHNNHHKNDNAGDETLENVGNIDDLDAKNSEEGETSDSDTVTTNDTDTILSDYTDAIKTNETDTAIINHANSVVTNDTNTVKTNDTDTVVSNEENSVVTNDKDTLHHVHEMVTMKTYYEGQTVFNDDTKENIDGNMTENINESEEDNEDMPLQENSLEIVDYGPIDRSIKENTYFGDDMLYDAEEAYGPPPLRDQEYFSAHFEVSPSYDLRSANFLRTLPADEGVGDETSTQLATQDDRIDRGDKTIFGGVIGGLSGVFGFLAGKKLILIFLFLGTLVAMGVTGTSPLELYESLTQYFLDATGLNFLYDLKVNGTIGYETGETSIIGSGMTVSQDVGGTNVTGSYYMDGPVKQMYLFLTKYTEELVQPMISFASEMGLIWTSFTEGFFNVTGTDFFTAERDERMADPLDIEHLKDQFEELQSFQPSEVTNPVLMDHGASQDNPNTGYQMNTQEYIFQDDDLIKSNKKHVNDIERVYYGEQSPAPKDLSMKTILGPAYDQQEPVANELSRNLVYGNDKADINIQDLIMPNINRIDNIEYPTETLDGGHDGEFQDMHEQARTAKADDTYDYTRFESNMIRAHGEESSNGLDVHEQLFQVKTDDQTNTESNPGHLDSTVEERKIKRRLIGPP